MDGRGVTGYQRDGGDGELEPGPYWVKQDDETIGVESA